MKKKLSLLLVLLLSLVVFGCTAKNPVPAKPPAPEQPPQEQVFQPGQAGFRPSLGGIKLGDSKEQLLQAFGSSYQEAIFDEALSLGEPFVRLRFPNGITAVVGSKTGKVLEIETSSPNTATNLGFKVGDKASDVLTKYRSIYQEPESRHGDGKLIGWFLLKDEELVIFNFAKGEGLVNNPKIEPEAKIERIKLTNFRYMD